MFTEGEKSGMKIRVLLLEDTDFDAKIIQDTLGNEGVEAEYVRAKGQEEYKSLLNKEYFDIVLSDYTIPGMSGMDALILAQQKLSEIPFIYLSGTTYNKAGLESLKYGASDFISKQDIHRLGPAFIKALNEAKEKQQLKTINHRFQTLLDKSNHLIITINDHEFIQSANTQAAYLFKSEPNMMTGFHLSTFFNKSTYQRFRDFILQVTETGSTKRTNILAELPYGNRWFDVKFIPEENSGNTPGNVIHLVMNDISNQLESSGEIVHKHEIMSVLFRDAPDAFYIRDHEGHILDINEAAERLTGYKRTELIGVHFMETGIIPSRSREAFRESLTKSNQGKNTDPVEFTIKHKTGKEVVVEKTAYPFTHKGQERVLGIVRNVTPRKEAEKKLKQSEEKFRALVNSTEDIIFLVDRNYVYQEIFGKGITKLGFDPSKYKGNNISEVFDEDTARIHKLAIDRALEGEFEVYNWIFENQGNYIYFQTSLSPIYDENNEIKQLVGIGRDITQMQEMLKEVEEAKEKAEENDRLKSAFLANISHEIRTPMNAIMGFTQLLRTSELSQEKQNEFLDIINGRADNLLQIIDDLIDISKIESNQLTLDKENLQLNEVVKEMEIFYAQVIKNKEKENLSIIAETPSNDITIHSDKGRLEQIISNLLDNAIKFTEKGKVKFGYTPYKSDKLLFYVIDKGIGIPAEQQETIFDSFRQVDNSITREFEGTGLGLAITKQLVNRLGGELWLESEEGKGSTFYFTLPSDSIKDKTAPDNRKKGGELDLNGRSIMVVEDDLASRRYVEELIKPTNARIILAPNGNIAWDKLMHNGEIDLVLMDIRLPDTNGLELTEKIKHQKPELPVIAQTAYAMKKDREEAFQKGCDDYISKPIKQSELFDIIKKNI